MKQKKMITVVVKKEFHDRYTGLKRKVGEEMSVTYDIQHRLEKAKTAGLRLEKIV